MSYVIYCWFRFLGCSFSGWGWFGSLLASRLTKPIIKQSLIISSPSYTQGCIFRLTCSHSELTNDHVLKSAYVKIFEPRNAVNFLEPRAAVNKSV